ncbi:nuclease-related domain-containing DEAD/DEAH box helicase [Parafrankia sp. BMG5.11]|uniref:nuclease-related domain-containing DEAD/DEAH box helicase n=1 Tax=Parafrankia sp. BMG5.11 TaxID=222540 RepID=UPI00103E6E43|nr:UvrD-helicase domain-containing protein [Parafrankia sp. BMG5.11]TCJ34772.1 DNA helicase UvrD [Parafrankia sp. BMG5.11]CAI7977197.1 DNA helicase [Frankia sp. Hr75.2]
MISSAALPTPSALGRAVELRQVIDGFELQLRHINDTLAQLEREVRRWEAGGRAEQSVARALVSMYDAGWHLLPDRQWPGTRRANIDVIVVGPGGVFVLDVKNWREFAIENGRLRRGDADADDDLRKLLDQTVAVEDVLADAGLPPTEVVPLLVMAGRSNLREQVDRVTVLGAHDLTRDLARRGARLAPDLVERLLTCLADGCPPMPRATDPPAPAARPVRRQAARQAPRQAAMPGPPTPSASGTPRAVTAAMGAPTAPVTPVTPFLPLVPVAPIATAPSRASVDGEAGQGALMSREDLWRELRDAADREPVETWMTWLHPKQARLAGRQWSGPARVRGAAGTGKTVVALHRAKYLAARGERVLFTTLVRTLGPVYRALLARMAPDHVDRVEFATVHAVAARCLREHGLAHQHQQDVADTCFWRAWGQVGQYSALPGLGLVTGYWKDEIATVIKGRGLTEFAQYAKLARVGRSTPLQPTHRRAVWDLYERYEQLRVERGVLDRDDVLLRARDLVRESSDTRYDAVIVDEVQDLTCVGLQMLHAFVGDRPDGLLVVGDGQQSIYPGGFTLAEAGVAVVGRSTVLARNYRNRERILRYAQAVLADDSFEDLDGVRERGRREVDVERPGGEIHEVTVSGETAQDAALCDHLVEFRQHRNVRYGDMAVLVPTNDAERRWLRVLTERGIPAVSLMNYDGTTCEAVKVGTYFRAKSLDFAHVCIPDRNLFPRPQWPSESADAFGERVQLERRQMYVAITRARDSVWAGIHARPGPEHPPGAGWLPS